jgi:hypothetical protein
MTVHLPFLLLAIALLWFPRHWLRVGSIFKHRRSAAATRSASEPWNSREPGDPRVRFGAEFAKFRNYVDLLRAAVGSLAFVGGFGIPACLAVAEGAPKSTGYAVIAIRSLILLIGLLIQTVRREKRKITFYPAIFYIAGLSLGLADPWSALFAFALIWATNALYSGAQGFLTMYAVFILGFGHLLARRGDLSVVYAAILCFVPVLLSLLANRPLVTFTRKGTHSAK